MDKARLEEIGRNIWTGYRLAKEGQTAVIRSGFGHCKVYPYDSNHPFNLPEDNRNESDAEHDYGMIVLTILLKEFYPDVITQDIFGNVLINVAFHELGENDTGDIADDGRRDNEAKDAQEFNSIKFYLERAGFSYASKRDILANLQAMQQKSSRIGEILYFIDKTEAVLQNIIYDRQGRGGDMSKKAYVNQIVSDKDQQSMLETGSTRPAVNWFRGFWDSYHEREIFPIFANIVREAMKDVYGVAPDWI